MAADGKTVQAQGTAAPPPTPLKMRLIDRVVDKMQKDTGALKEILLCEMKLTDDDMALLATEVKKTGSVCSLSLFGSQISEKAAESLASALASHKSLTMLDLGRNKLNTSGVEAVCNALIRNSSLKTLGLAGNAMGNQGARPSPQPRPAARAALSTRPGCGAGATAVAHVLRVNRSLTEVYLNSNDIEVCPARASAARRTSPRPTQAAHVAGGGGVGAGGGAVVQRPFAAVAAVCA
jgi:Leucine-rich repeat (LRR) protein